MAKEKRQDFYRFSLVRMYYSDIAGRFTPTPIAEFRAFVFLDHEPTNTEKILLKKRLSELISGTEELAFVPFYKSLESGKTMPYPEDETELKPFSMVKKEGKIMIEIDGFEVEEIDVEEVSEYFKGIKERIQFGKPYRYVIFFKEDRKRGMKARYFEEDIRRFIRNELKKREEESLMGI